MYSEKNANPATGGHAPAQGAARIATEKPLRDIKSRGPFLLARIDVLEKTNQGIKLVDEYYVEYGCFFECLKTIFDFFKHSHFSSLALRVNTVPFTFYWHHDLASKHFESGEVPLHQLVEEMVFNRKAEGMSESEIFNQ
jgi:hypothetical protein